MTATARTRAEQVRDLVMAVLLTVWIIYAGAAVVQLFMSGAKVLDSLPPFWWWGIPLAPYTALYAPWRGAAAVLPGMTPEPPQPPAEPTPPETAP